MFVLGASVVADVIALVIAISGLGSLVFAAMRWRRDDTQAIVSTQSVVVHDMEALMAGLRQALDDCERRRAANAG